MTCPRCLHCAEVAKAARAQGKGPFVPMRDLFVKKWEAKYGDKYLFEPQDAVQLNAMIKRHPALEARWGGIVDRYLAEDFWGLKRHPLRVLATRPGEFATDKKAAATAARERAVQDDLFATDRKLAEYRRAQSAPAPSLEELRALRGVR